jgi:hypothetical protein
VQTDDLANRGVVFDDERAKGRCGRMHDLIVTRTAQTRGLGSGPAARRRIRAA